MSPVNQVGSAAQARGRERNKTPPDRMPFCYAFIPRVSVIGRVGERKLAAGRASGYAGTGLEAISQMRILGCRIARGAALAAMLFAPGPRAVAAEPARTLLALPLAAETVIELTDASTNMQGGMLRIETGERLAWPGIYVHAPGPAGRWDLTGYTGIVFEVQNAGSNAVEVFCRLDNGDRNIRPSCSLEPGGWSTVRVGLDGLRPVHEVELAGMKGNPGLTVFDDAPIRVSQIPIVVGAEGGPHVFEIGPIRAEGVWTRPEGPLHDPAKFFPFVDTFGQYRHRDWPGKTHSEEELRARATAEAKELAASPGPAGWDAWGGWKDGPQLEASGFFRTTKRGGRWWLVDPDGHLFWSHGVDGVAARAPTPVTADRATWFQDYPGGRPEFKACLAQAFVQYNFYEDCPAHTVTAFDFGQANVQRKYGADAWRKSAAVAHQRLRSWGLNTLGNGSDSGIRDMRRTPFIAAVRFDSRKLAGGWWKDCFDPDFARQLRAALAREKGCGDPWCLGFLLEMEAGADVGLSCAVAALCSPADQPTKREFVSDLKAKYGEIEKLNEAWGTTNVSWEALAGCRGAGNKEKVREDLVAFSVRVTEQYFKIVRACIKEAAPHQLYFSGPFNGTDSMTAAVAAKYCNVVSYKIDRRSVAEFKPGCGALAGGADVPLLVGEFDFGAQDCGLFHTGHVEAKDQTARAAAYRDYVTGALRDPRFVGTHWFQFMDEAASGRPSDGENRQLGLVDVCDTPYTELVAAVREVGARLYETRMRP